MRRFKSRRGISSAIVGAIMLTGTTVLGITLVSWAHSSVATNEYGLASSASGKSNAFNEYLTIENIWFCKGGGNPEPCHARSYNAVNITIANYGNIGFNVTQIKFNNTNYLNTTNVAIFPGKEYSWAQAYPWHSGMPQNIFITTARGSLFTTQVTPP
jgi:hypothetical protein